MSQVIEGTFQSISSSAELPNQLVPDVLHRFASREGYELYPDVLPFFAWLQRVKTHAGLHTWSEIVVGIVSNSDDRVPDILTSLGVSVASCRFQTRVNNLHLAKQEDVNFVIHSYDVGAEKPDRRIFEAARETADAVSRLPDTPAVHIHIGDDFDKDYLGAERAGFRSILMSGYGRSGDGEAAKAPNVQSMEDLRQVKDIVQTTAA